MNAKYTPTASETGFARLRQVMIGSPMAITKAQAEAILKSHTDLVWVNQALLKLVKRHATWIKRNPDLICVEDHDWLGEAKKIIAKLEDSKR